MWYKGGSVTLEDALNALSGIEYTKRSGNHVISYDDEDHPEYSLIYDRTPQRTVSPSNSAPPQST